MKRQERMVAPRQNSCQAFFCPSSTLQSWRSSATVTLPPNDFPGGERWSLTAPLSASIRTKKRHTSAKTVDAERKPKVNASRRFNMPRQGNWPKEDTTPLSLLSSSQKNIPQPGILEGERKDKKESRSREADLAKIAFVDRLLERLALVDLTPAATLIQRQMEKIENDTGFPKENLDVLEDMVSGDVFVELETPKLALWDMENDRLVAKDEKVENLIHLLSGGDKDVERAMVERGTIRRRILRDPYGTLKTHLLAKAVWHGLKEESSRDPLEWMRLVLDILREERKLAETTAYLRRKERPHSESRHLHFHTEDNERTQEIIQKVLSVAGSGKDARKGEGPAGSDRERP